MKENLDALTQALRNIPLADANSRGVFISLLAVSLVVLAIWARKKLHTAVLGTAVLIGIAWLLLHKWGIPLYIYGAAAVAVLAVIRALLSREKRWLCAAMAVVATLGAAGLSNIQYQTFPDVGSLDPQPVAREMNLDEFHHTTSGGAVEVHFNLPGTVSGFAAREAIAYVPPAYFSQPDLRLPVILLLHGNPGGPTQWFGPGQAAETADAFQAANGGVGPIVVAVDATGSETANPVCTDSPMANVMTYLTQDVPNFLHKEFRVDENHAHWSVGGLSYGGTCALQVATTHPDLFGTVINLSGEPEPTIGNHQATVDKFFGGSEEKFNAQDPAHLLATNTYPNITAIFVAGQQDAMATNGLRSLSAAARKAGMASYYGERPGGHSFQVWRPGLREAFAYAARRGGLKDVVDPFDGVEDADVHL